MARPKPRKLKPGEQTVLENAKKKQAGRGKLTVRESKVVDKAEHIRRTDALDAFLPNVPASFFFESCGDTLHKVKTVIDKHEIPIPKQGGKTFELRAFFRWLYDYFSNERYLPEDDELLLSVDPQRVYHKEKAIRERIKRLQDEGKFVPVDIVQEVLYRYATVLRLTGERLGERYGDDVLEEINEAVEEARDHIKDILTLNANAEDDETGDKKDGD